MFISLRVSVSAIIYKEVHKKLPYLKNHAL